MAIVNASANAGQDQSGGPARFQFAGALMLPQV
jgi:hypothetical protein